MKAVLLNRQKICTVLAILFVLVLLVKSQMTLAQETEYVIEETAESGSAAEMFGGLIYFDINGNGEYDEGEGLEGIIVQLFDVNGNRYPSVYTDENGRYLFNNISSTNRYTVKIDPDSVPIGFINTIDPDGGAPLEAEIVLEESFLINFPGADFGFTIPTDSGNGSISGKVWDDMNGDGIINDLPSGNAVFSGVSVSLYLDTDGNGMLDQNQGDRLLSSTVTDFTGLFYFDELSANNVSYLVRVNEESGLLENYWSVIGASEGRCVVHENNSCPQNPYAITLTEDEPVYDTADFGYTRGLGAVGNRVWLDMNNNGIQDDGEQTGVPGTVVQLTIHYPRQSIVTEQDASDGFYSFYGLGADESYFSEGEITYELSVRYDESMYVPAKIDAISNEMLDSDDPAGEQFTVNLGQFDLTMQTNPMAETLEASYDFGFVPIEFVYMNNDVDDSTLPDSLSDTGIITVTNNPDATVPDIEFGDCTPVTGDEFSIIAHAESCVSDVRRNVPLSVSSQLIQATGFPSMFMFFNLNLSLLGLCALTLMVYRYGRT